MLPTSHRGKTWSEITDPRTDSPEPSFHPELRHSRRKEAILFVQDSPLKYQLFIQQYSRVTTESEVVAKTIKAVQEATEALALFDTAAESSTATDIKKPHMRGFDMRYYLLLGVHMC
jgi:hypothetical protein